jgi:hypothetical protein
MVRRITKRDSPKAIELQVGFHERRLLRAVEVAAKRATRSTPEIQALFASAKVCGQAKGNHKIAVVSYQAPPFLGGLHQFFPWEYLDLFSQSELSKEVSTALRSYLSLQKREPA